MMFMLDVGRATAVGHEGFVCVEDLVFRVYSGSKGPRAGVYCALLRCSWSWYQFVSDLILGQMID